MNHEVVLDWNIVQLVSGATFKPTVSKRYLSIIAHSSYHRSWTFNFGIK